MTLTDVDHDRLTTLVAEVAQIERKIVGQMGDIIELQRGQMHEAVQCPFYPGKSGNGGEMIIERLRKVENTVNHFKWWLGGTLAVFTVESGIVLLLLQLWRLL